MRNNLLMLAVWFLLFLFLTGVVGKKYGLNLLFLAPEYLGDVNFYSFSILGFAFGALYISWNLTSYLLTAHYFPFLASLEKPFTKFCLNNSLIPVVFVLVLLSLHVQFEGFFSYGTFSSVLVNTFGFLIGGIVFLILSSIYFHYTNKDIGSFIKTNHKGTKSSKNNNVSDKRQLVLDDIKSEKSKWRVDNYLSFSLRPRPVRSVTHYDVDILRKVFKQNHTNAFYIQLISILVLIGLGLLIEYPFFRIPAGASVFVLGSMLFAFVGALSYWFARWRMVFLIIVLLTLNYLTSKEYLRHSSKAYGLNYHGESAEYSHEKLKDVFSLINWQNDVLHTTKILETWKNRVQKNSFDKPKMVLFCVSGGGLKSAVWAMNLLQHADSITNQKLMQHTVLMAGASGGLLGTAYFRELKLRQLTNPNVNPYQYQHLTNMSKDLLNIVSFSIATNDLLMPMASFHYNGNRYRKDRGYFFEEQLNENLGNTMSKELKDYTQPEILADIPLMFFTPSIVNDGRRLIISSQPVSYMMAPPTAIRNPKNLDIDAVDFKRVFQKQGSDELRVLSALRANATFPYILPNIYLPSNPKIEIMDAGFRDNFGLKSAIRFAHVFKDWAIQNTSGIIFVEVTGFDRDMEISPSDNQGIIGSLFNPLGIASQVIDLQFYENDNNMSMLVDLFGGDFIESIQFTYKASSDNFETPISFHLTERGRDDIINAIDLPHNQQALNRLKQVLEVGAQPYQVKSK